MEQSIEARSGELMIVPLSMLVASPRNVRKTDGTDVTSLKASIKAQGVMQNLIVCPARTKRGKPSGKYEVVGGKRRLAALTELAAEGDIAPDEGIVCRVKDTHEAAEASLAENVHRVAMHPADEFEAFRQLVQEGRSVDELALRFGCSPLTVRRRLKLADVHPALLALYREDGITLEQLMALTVSDDQAEQLRVWEAAPHWRRNPTALREALTANEIDAAHDPLAKLVGLDAYEAAGGQVRRDLFSEDGEGYVQDARLLERLAIERLEAAAEGVRAEGWSWVEVLPCVPGSLLFQFAKAPRTRRDMTKAQAKKHAALAKRAQQLAFEAAAEDSGDEGEEERLSTALEAAQDELAAFEEQLMSYGDDAYASAGAIVCVGRSGQIEVHRGLVRAKPSETKKRDTKAGDGEGTEGAEANEPARERPVHSSALVLDLTALRTLAVRAAMLNQPGVALCVLLDGLVQRLLYEGYQPPYSSVRLVPNAPDTGLHQRTGRDWDECRAIGELSDARQRWGDRLPGEAKRLLPWLMNLDESDRMDLLALCVALSLNDVRDTERDEPTPMDKVCEVLELSMADWWEPTAEGYFGRITKDAILAAIEEGAGREGAARVKGVSKAELARLAERELKGKRWLPSALKVKAESVDDAEDGATR